MAVRPAPTSRPRTASRVGAVQALFQAEQAGTSPEAVIDEFVRHRLGELHGDGFEDGRVPDAHVPLFAAIVRAATAQQELIDPMIAAAHLLLALQTIVSRSVDPLDSAVITIGSIQAGSAANQIPGQAVMRGTMRILSNEVRDHIEQTIHRIADGVARTFDVSIDVQIPRGNPVTGNAPAERDLAAEATLAAGLKLRRDMLPAMTSEDFSWYLLQRPGAFVWIGNGPTDGGRALHNAKYDFNDEILPAASGFLASVAKRALQ